MDQLNTGASDTRDDEITIDLTELISAVWAKIYIVILAGVACAAVLFIGTKLFITPQYTSETKVYVLSRQSDDSSLTYNDIQISNQLVNDYAELITSRPVMETTISVLDLDMTANELAKTVSSSIADSSRIITIYVENPDPVEAKEIADVVREAAAIQIMEITDAESVNTVEEASLPNSPSSPNTFRNTIMGGMLGVIAAVAVIVIITILDDTIKAPDDVEHYLGLNVLASIPVQEEAKDTQSSRSSGKKSRSRRSSSGSTVKGAGKNGRNHT